MEHGGGGLDESLFPPGYRFQPLDDQLIDHYLTNKVKNRCLPPNRISEVKVYDHNPEDLVENYPSYGGHEWYFFTSRDRKYPNGCRPSRSAGHGFWKASGTDKKIFSNGIEVGLKRTLVFYVKKSKEESEKDEKSKWIMHEYVLANDAECSRPIMENKMMLDQWVLCKIYERKGKCTALEDDTILEVKQKEKKLRKPSQPAQILKNESAKLGRKTRGRKRKPSKGVDNKKKAGEADNPKLESSRNESSPSEIPNAHTNNGSSSTTPLISTDGYIPGSSAIQIGAPQLQIPLPKTHFHLPQPHFGYSSTMSNMDFAYDYAECVAPITALGPSSSVMPFKRSTFPHDYTYGFSSVGHIEDRVFRFKEDICDHIISDNAYDSTDFLIGTDVLPETTKVRDPSSHYSATALRKLPETL